MIHLRPHMVNTRLRTTKGKATAQAGKPNQLFFLSPHDAHLYYSVNCILYCICERAIADED